MKKNWTLLDEYKLALNIYIFFAPILALVFIIWGIIGCINYPDNLGGHLTTIGTGVAIAMITVGCIIYIKKKIKYLEEQEMEKYKLEYLASEAIRIKEEQEKGRTKTIDDNDSNS